MGSHSLLQGIFPTQELNPGLLPFRWSLYHLSHQGRPLFIIITVYSVTNHCYQLSVLYKTLLFLSCICVMIAFDTQSLCVSATLSFTLEEMKFWKSQNKDYWQSLIWWVSTYCLLATVYLLHNHPRKERELIVWMFLGHLGVWKPLRSTTYAPTKDRTQAQVHSREDPLQILIDDLCAFSWRTICCLYKGLLPGSEASQNEHIWWVRHPDEKCQTCK